MPSILTREDRYGTDSEIFKTITDARAAAVLEILSDPSVLRDDDLIREVLQPIAAGDFVHAIETWNEAQAEIAEEKGVYFSITPCRQRTGSKLTKDQIRERASKALAKLDGKR